jgi:hypothetical protein
LGCHWIEGPQPAGFVWLDKPRGLQLIKGLMSLWSWWCWCLTFWEDSYVNLKWERFDLRNFFYKFCVKYLPPRLSGSGQQSPAVYGPRRLSLWAFETLVWG